MMRISKYDPARSPGYFAISADTLQLTKVAPKRVERPEAPALRPVASNEAVARRAFAWLCSMNFPRPERWEDLRGFAFDALQYRPWIDRKQGGRKDWLLAAIESGDIGRIGATIRKALALRTANQWLSEYHNAPRLKRNPETGDAVPVYQVKEDYTGTAPDFAPHTVALIDGERAFKALTESEQNRIMAYLSGAVLPSYYREALKRKVADRGAFCLFLSEL